MSVRRVCVVGNLASGKSYFSKMVGDELEIPVTHLDDFYWRSDWTIAPGGEFRDKCSEVLNQEEWVMDGSYPEFNMIRRFRRADAVVFIDIPIKSCFDQMNRRRAEVRDDFPANEHEIKFPFLIGVAFVARVILFNVLDRAFIMNAVRRSKTPFIHIHTWEEEDAALALLRDM